MTELNAQPAAVYRPGQVYTGADGDLLFVILPGDDIEFVTNRGTRVTVAEVERVYAPLTLIGTEAVRLAADLEQSRWCAKELEKQRDAHKTEAEQFRATLDGLRALTRDEDGNVLPPESELPVGVFYGLLYGEEGPA